MEESKPCCFCGKDFDDAVKFGKKVSVGDTTAHHFCVLFSSNLRPKDTDDGDNDGIGMFGFSSSDIEKEVRRAAKLVNIKQL